MNRAARLSITTSGSLVDAPHVLLYVPVLEVTLHWASSSTKTQPEERVFLKVFTMQVN